MKFDPLFVAQIFSVGVLLVFAAAKFSYWKHPSIRTARYGGFVRGLAAFVAIAAVLTTTIGTWRGNDLENVDEFEVIVPTRAPHEIVGSDRPGPLDIGPSKLIINVIIARQAGDRFIPLQRASRSIRWNGGMVTSHLNLVWQGVPLVVSVGFGNFSQDNGILSFWKYAGEPAIRVTHGGDPTYPLAGGRAFEMLNVEPFEAVTSLLRSPFSLVPIDLGEVSVLVHVARAELDDPLGKAPVGTWFANQPLAPGWVHQIGRYRRFSSENSAPGFRMLSYLGPAACWLALAAIAGSLWFRRGRRVPAFAGLTVAMVLYAGSLDALVLQHRLQVMKDASLPELTRFKTLLSLQSTFFHKARANAAIDGISRDAKAPALLRETAGRMIVTGD